MTLTALRDRRAVVLGGSGFIGPWVARALTDAGAIVTCPARVPAKARAALAARGARADVPSLDLVDDAAIEALLARVRPAVVFDLASHGVAPDERDEVAASRVNAELPAVLVAAMVRHRDATWPGRAIVRTGSALEYGDVGGDLAEDGPCHPTTLYGRTKLAGTRALATAAHDAGLSALTARLFTVYGPGERAGRLLPTLLAARRTDAPIPLTEGRQRRDFSWVGDVAEGLLRLATTDGPWGEAVNLATGQLTEVRAFVARAAATLGIAADRLQFGEVPTRSWEMRHEPVHITRLRALTGWQPTTTIESGVARAVEIEG